MNNSKCEICGRKIKDKDIRCIIFHITGETFGIPHPYPVGKHYLSCVECDASYMAQFYKLSNKEVESWLNWTLRVSKEK